jgi:hypothetical protein
MPKFRKKPVVVEAYQWITGNAATISEWAGEAVKYDEDRQVFLINTLEGIMTAQKGDYIIKGVKDEFYPCREDIFNATYEPAHYGFNQD